MKKLFIIFFNLVVSFSVYSQQLRWAFNVKDASSDYGVKITTDVYGDVVATGVYASSYIGTADFDPSSGTDNVKSTSFTQDVYIAKYDKDGSLMIENSGLITGIYLIEIKTIDGYTGNYKLFVK